MIRFLITALILLSYTAFAQLPVARDTITVIENGYVLKMPWGNGINFTNMSSVDLNLDGKKDLVAFDKYNLYSEGRFRCFIKTGGSGMATYTANTYYSYSFPRVFNWAVFHDYNNDGLEDLFCSGNSDVAVYKNVSTAAATPSFVLVKPKLMTNINPAGTPLWTALFVSVIGVPGIADVDADGDLDILTFSSQGTFVELNKNMSKELYGNADSLVFYYVNNCWGKLAESNCTVDFNLCGSGSITPLNHNQPLGKELHAGSCLTCIDNDSDGDKDMVMGDISCDEVQYVHNNGTVSAPLFNDTTKIFPNYQNNNTTPVRINNFPCGYYLDVDGDSRRDLLFSPNTNNSENFKSLWYYRDASTTGTANFLYVKNNFLQDEMIEVGQNSFPVLFDYNSDGKKDLLIGNYGYYINNSLSARLTLYINTGTSTQPTYSLLTRDLGGISMQPNISCAMPTIGDIDGDGDTDICFGTSTGKIHWLENTAGAGNVCNFSVFHNNPFGFTTNSAMAAPQLFDLDADGKLDFLIGTKNGRIAYYQNIGTTTAPVFTLVTNSLGGVLTTDDPLLFGYDGYAVPFFYVEGGVTKLLVGSVTGKIFQYTVPSNVLATFNLISPFVNGLYEGGQSAVAYEDINNDGKRDLLVGNASGGLLYLSSASAFVGIAQHNANDVEAQIRLFPNPAGGQLGVNINGIEFSNGSLSIFDLPGKLLIKNNLEVNNETLDISSLEPGVYLVKIRFKSGSGETIITKRIIKE